MGRLTYESIGKALPGRTNIVVTRQDLQFDGATTMHTVEEAIEFAKQKDEQEIFIIGGQKVYEAALPYTERLYLTLIDAEQDADTFFPAYDGQFTKKVSQEDRAMNDLKYSWVVLEK
jgi:dihydrofolate reductase